ncbi:formimidoylglutamate deiminase [Paracidobacterium acidisoli]|uniref:Formimidoylglutamate deiminase n=1 Tax=Paracidobacterium acidisoli TaxID=2303751 RepID=A0A372IK34_9BACT|nr:formimidoylglutamate deiminase [Paracidobacterium acidisoli]MBT9333163.1 formimidoylglutamate deiminase [Paracidobacterium acidisoli]
MPHFFHPDLVFTEGAFRSGCGLLVKDDGWIEAVLRAEDTAAWPATRLAGKALLPGCVNAHSHSFQRLIRGRSERHSTGGDDFWSWREAMYRAAAAVSDEDVYDVARMTFLEMVTAGITTVGEFHYLHRSESGAAYSDPNRLGLQVVAAAESVGLRIALLRVAYLRAGYGLAPHAGQARFYESAAEYLENAAALADALHAKSGRAWMGVAPHSIRAVPLKDLEQMALWATEHALPIHMHAAEQPAELAACREEYGATPVRLLAELGLLSDAWTLVHAIHITEEEMEAMAAARTTVCACPATERNLGDGVFDAARAAGHGIRIALGSDSQAQIDLLEDARELEYHLRLTRQKRGILDGIGGRDLSERLFGYATAGGAAALGFDGGVLAPGYPADFFTVDLDHPSIAGAAADDLLPSLVFSLQRGTIRDVAVGGRWILRDGLHSAAEEIVARYKEIAARVWRQ